jgi:hypothetical protein
MAQIGADIERDMSLPRILSSAWIGVICGRIALLCVVVGETLFCCCAAARGAPQLVRWDVAATVVFIDDPDDIFTEVRLGDPVRGTLAYDVNTFQYPNWFNLVTMTIDNPRTGEALQFPPDVEGPPFASALWYDAYPEVEGADDDWLAFGQSVVAPLGFTGVLPGVTVEFGGPPNVLSGENPLEDLWLENWPYAAIYFYSVDLESFPDFSHFLEAEIYSLTPVESPLPPGDFNYDGDIDAGDLYAWRDSIGSTEIPYADGDGDGVVAGGDFLIWQRQLSGGALIDIAARGVPEPASAAFITVAGLALSCIRRPARRIVPATNA